MDLFLKSSRVFVPYLWVWCNKQLTTVILSCYRTLLHCLTSCTTAVYLTKQNLCWLWLLMISRKVVQLLPPDLCSGSLPSVEFYCGPWINHPLRHSHRCPFYIVPFVSSERNLHAKPLRTFQVISEGRYPAHPTSCHAGHCFWDQSRNKAAGQ